jgi:hypothetical protein
MKKALAVALALILLAVPIVENANNGPSEVQRVEQTMPTSEVDNCKAIQNTVSQEVLDKEGWTYQECILAFEK